MTFVTETVVTGFEPEVMDASYMALVDEFGHETPITELDIRRSLKQLAEEDTKQTARATEEAYQSLMVCADAARAIA